ncbi:MULTISPECIES: response regulator transcription factor [unclassified Curtobacterium]|uniref:response regulator transcription factor n=1 Tax=unclassified Curtobacterium TaxID=257496 RepID=UPI0008DD7C52|nr:MULTISPECIES: response regulator transcription factor [unclassified Curtobacterium]OIH99574.1 helix-turn-helix transcriptional regulator [Curtobacterium sp. MCBA15_003]OII11479.1 helix-turn-helix transcriptional regulator [Curtobacterium sp. MCBA15_009]OII30591.1 helix-turn-helix transcriptional regulator [Curtobacterium sp. MMLR14_006]
MPERIRVALVNDYELVLRGLADMLAPFSDRLEIVQLDARERVSVDVGVALYDTFAQPEPDDEDVSRLVANPRIRAVAVFTWKMDESLISAATRRGATGYFAKSISGAELADGLLRVAAGESVIGSPRRRVPSGPGVDWPGREHGISDRQSEILALITQGKRNAEIAELVHLSPNTVKTHIRTLYSKIGAVNRVDAVLWGSEHGFRPDHRSIDR